MKLLQVKKGQFVYFENELHKVYAVKALFTKAIHLYRLKDMKQTITNSNKIEQFQPKHMDTFIFCGNRYKIDKDKLPQSGDCILIVNPAPNLLDHYASNEILKVDSVEEYSVVTTCGNGVKHGEYLVMSSGNSAENRDIAYYDRKLVSSSQLEEDESTGLLQKARKQCDPSVGDIYFDAEENVTSMVVVKSDTEIIFGHGRQLHITDLLDKCRYELVYCSEEPL